MRPQTGRIRPAASAFAARVAALAVAALALTCCSVAAGSQAKAPTLHTVVVLAASSLTESLTAIANDF